MLKITKRGARAWVTFTFPAGRENVRLKGSWNGWRPEAMRRKKNGDFYLMKVLPAGSSHEFGYDADGEWVVEEGLPRVATPFGSENALLQL